MPRPSQKARRDRRFRDGEPNRPENQCRSPPDRVLVSRQMVQTSPSPSTGVPPHTGHGLASSKAGNGMDTGVSSVSPIMVALRSAVVADFYPTAPRSMPGVPRIRAVVNLNPAGRKRTPTVGDRNRRYLRHRCARRSAAAAGPSTRTRPPPRRRSRHGHPGLPPRTGPTTLRCRARSVGRLAAVAPLARRRRAGRQRRLIQSRSYWDRVAEGIHLPAHAEDEASP